MEDVSQQLREIKTQLRLSMNGSASGSMREKGLRYKLNFGVELPRLKQIAAQTPQSHDLAQALWKEDIRECKILAGMLQPVETFYPEIMDIWIEAMSTPEIAQHTSASLFRHLPYAPQKCMQLIGSDGLYAQLCGYLTISHLLRQKNDMGGRAGNEFLDQAIGSFLTGNAWIRKAVATALRVYMRGSEEHSFAVCRLVERMRESTREAEQLLYNWVREEVEEHFMAQEP